MSNNLELLLKQPDLPKYRVWAPRKVSIRNNNDQNETLTLVVMVKLPNNDDDDAYGGGESQYTDDYYFQTKDLVSAAHVIMLIHTGGRVFGVADTKDNQLFDGKADVRRAAFHCLLTEHLSIHTTADLTQVDISFTSVQFQQKSFLQSLANTTFRYQSLSLTVYEKNDDDNTKKVAWGFSVLVRVLTLLHANQVRTNKLFKAFKVCYIYITFTLFFTQNRTIIP